jgi:hypothetical protein
LTNWLVKRLGVAAFPQELKLVIVLAPQQTTSDVAIFDYRIKQDVHHLNMHAIDHCVLSAYVQQQLVQSAIKA